jgi:hypothetical protein
MYESGSRSQRREAGKAFAKFAMAYSDQTESDHRVLLEAIESGRITAETGI